MPARQKFTLVELGIVLAILVMLIGGVLKSRQMSAIASAGKAAIAQRAG